MTDRRTKKEGIRRKKRRISFLYDINEEEYQCRNVKNLKFSEVFYTDILTYIFPFLGVDAIGMSSVCRRWKEAIRKWKGRDLDIEMDIEICYNTKTFCYCRSWSCYLEDEIGIQNEYFPYLKKLEITVAEFGYPSTTGIWECPKLEKLYITINWDDMNGIISMLKEIFIAIISKTIEKVEVSLFHCAFAEEVMVVDEVDYWIQNQKRYPKIDWLCI